MLNKAEQLKDNSFTPRIFEGNIERNKHQTWVESGQNLFFCKYLEFPPTELQILHDVKHGYLKEIKS